MCIFLFFIKDAFWVSCSQRSQCSRQRKSLHSLNWSVRFVGHLVQPSGQKSLSYLCFTALNPHASIGESWERNMKCKYANSSHMETVFQSSVYFFQESKIFLAHFCHSPFVRRLISFDSEFMYNCYSSCVSILLMTPLIWFPWWNWPLFEVFLRFQTACGSRSPLWAIICL